MLGELAFLRDLAIVMVAAAASAIAFSRLKQTAVLGYIVAGLAVGPHSGFSLVDSTVNVETLAQLGVIFLLFSLGLEFHLTRLRRVGSVAVGAGILEIALMLALGYGAGRALGWDPTNSVFLAAILAISSTTIIVKVLSEERKLDARWADVIFGILIVEDVAAVVIMALLSSAAIGDGWSLVTVVTVLTRVGVFITVSLVAGILVIPRLVDYLSGRSEEILVIASLGFAFALALFGASLGLSVAIGAFIAGAVIAEARSAAHVERKVVALRDAFTAVFFVAVGMLLVPAVILGAWKAILVISLVALFGKIACVGFATFVAGYAPRDAVKIGIGLAMVGEFSFIIASLATTFGVARPELFAAAIAASAITTAITPLLLRNADRITETVAGILPARVLRELRSFHASRVANRRSSADAALSGDDVVPSQLTRLVAFTALFGGLVFTAKLASDWATGFFGPRIVFDGDVVAVVWALFALLSLPVAAGAVTSFRLLVAEIVERAVPPERQDPRSDSLRRLLGASFWLFGAIAASIVAVALASTFLPPLPLVLPALILILGASAIFWQRLQRLHDQVEAAVDVVFTEPPPPEEKSALLRLIREKYSWNVHVEGVQVAEGSRVAHHNIRELKLPQTTGATIVSVEHLGRRTVNPGPETVIHGGDRIVVMGEREQVDAARAILQERAPAKPNEIARDVELVEIPLPDGSPLAGLTLAGTRLREAAGASVVGLRREGQPVINPPPVTRLVAGDVLLVLGSRDQIAKARDVIHGKA